MADANTNWLGNINSGLSQVSDLIGNANQVANQWNNIGQPTTYDKLGNVDVTAPGATNSVGSNPFFDITGQYVPGQAAAAADIFNQGPTALNPLQQDAYNQVSPVAQQQANLAQQGYDYTQGLLDPNSAYNQELAGAAGAANAGTFGANGTFGGLRNSFGANEAAANAILKNQQTGFNNIGTAQTNLANPINLQNTYGQQYNDWETNTPWEHLGKFQDATAFGQNVPTNTISTNTPSGADIWDKTLDKQVFEQYGIEGLRALAGGDVSADVLQANAPKSYAGPLGQAQQTVDTIGNTINTAADIWDTGNSIWNSVSDWF